MGIPRFFCHRDTQGRTETHLACALFTLYCLPWNNLLNGALDNSIGPLLLIDDWSWAAMMAPMTLWYIASLRWMDRHDGWVPRPVGAEI